MPQPRIHASAAERQAAFRARREQARQSELATKGLPSLPIISSMPGWPRWIAIFKMAHAGYPLGDGGRRQRTARVFRGSLGELAGKRAWRGPPGTELIRRSSPRRTGGANLVRRRRPRQTRRDFSSARSLQKNRKVGQNPISKWAKPGCQNQLCCQNQPDQVAQRRLV
jgi:hypothetical protein